MEARLRSHMLTLARGYAAARPAVSLSGLSKTIFNDNTFFTRMEAGKNFTARSYDKALGWFDEHWPSEVPWPADVPRPELASGQPASETPKPEAA